MARQSCKPYVELLDSRQGAESHGVPDDTRATVPGIPSHLRLVSLDSLLGNWELPGAGQGSMEVLPCLAAESLRTPLDSPEAEANISVSAKQLCLMKNNCIRRFAAASSLGCTRYQQDTDNRDSEICF